MRILSVAIIGLVFLASCSKKNNSLDTSLTKAELTSQRWKEFADLYTWIDTTSSGFFRYTDLHFFYDGHYEGVVKFGIPAAFIPETGNYVYDEINKTIKWPDVDTLYWGAPIGPSPFYRANWEFQYKNDGKLFFKRNYQGIDTTRHGTYEASGTQVVLMRY